MWASNPGASGPFRFLNLPAELRLEIYMHILCEGTIQIGRACTLTRDGGPAWRVVSSSLDSGSFNILRISRTIYDESRPFLYSDNKFDIPYSLLKLFLATIGRINARHLKELNHGFTTWDIWHTRSLLVHKNAFNDYVGLSNLTKITMSHITQNPSVGDHLQPSIEMILLVQYLNRVRDNRPRLSAMVLQPGRHVSIVCGGREAKDEAEGRIIQLESRFVVLQFLMYCHRDDDIKKVISINPPNIGLPNEADAVALRNICLD
ncbi:hypothetical protein MMC18_003712 [Xylographa bjoerkii]|nr:hypothetical protein [Xylographa bjoerkii]